MSTRVAYLGPGQGSFGYLATRKFFDGRCSSAKPIGVRKIVTRPYRDHASVIRAVGSGEAEFGVVAIANSTDGIIHETVRSMEEIKDFLGVAIYAEVILPIKLFYMKKGDAGEIPERVLSHSSPLRQASQFISALREKGVIVEQVASTDEAARQAAEDPSIAILASRETGEMYGLDLIQEDSVEDDKGNETRFWVISKNFYPRKKGIKYRTCFLCYLEMHREGGLFETFRRFFEAKPPVNISLLYPTPIIGRNWEYAFLIEVEGHVLDDNISTAWKKLHLGDVYLGGPTCLGSYSIDR